MRRSLLAIALGVAATIGSVGGASVATAQRPEHVTVRDVRLTASPVRSSVGVPREPEIEVHNGASEARTLEIVSVESIGAGERRVHRVTGNVRRVLRPGARVRIVIGYRDDPVPSGEGGLGIRRFRVRVRVDGQNGAVLTTTAYMCRIPVRLDR